MTEEKTILLTQEAYDKLKEELTWREGSTAMRSPSASRPHAPKAICPRTAAIRPHARSRARTRVVSTS